MTQITITVPNESEANWILGLLTRLRVTYEVENEESKRNRAKEIIRQGANSLDAHNMIKHVQEARQERSLPFEER